MNKKELFEYLKIENYNIKRLEEDFLERIVISYKTTELINLIFDKNILKVEKFNEILYNDFLKKEANLENIKKYLVKFKEKIDEGEEADDIDEEEVIYDYDLSGVIVREIPTQIGFSSLMDYMDKNMFVIPKNQRNYVWTRDQVEKLAVSLIRGFPIPPLYGYRNERNQLIILDGQQRLVSLYLYCKSKFLKNTSKIPIDLRGILSSTDESETKLLDQLQKEFGLKDEKYLYKYLDKTGKEKSMDITYKNLDNEAKRLIDFRTISIVEIMVQSKYGKEDIFFKIFGNLNQGGTQLKNQELRNGIYQCEFYDMLHKLNNENQKWRKLFGPKHRHYRDVELLLRLAAVEYMFEFKDEEFNLEGYKRNEEKNKKEIKRFESSYPNLLNRFSKIAMNFNNEEIEGIKDKIELFLKRISFDNDKKLPNLLLEALYVASLNINGDFIIEEDFIIEMEKNVEYQNYIGSSSSSKSKVKGRLELVYKKMKERYGDNNE